MTKIDFSPGSQLAVLFHKAWGQAKASPEYDKKVWTQIDKILSGDAPRKTGTDPFEMPD